MSDRKQKYVITINPTYIKLLAKQELGYDDWTAQNEILKRVSKDIHDFIEGKKRWICRITMLRIRMRFSARGFASTTAKRHATQGVLLSTFIHKFYLRKYKQIWQQIKMQSSVAHCLN